MTTKPLLIAFLIVAFVVVVSAQNLCYCSCCKGFSCDSNDVGKFKVGSCDDCSSESCQAEFTECPQNGESGITVTICYPSAGANVNPFFALVASAIVLFRALV